MGNNFTQPEPFISAEQNLPEITIKGTILAILLTIILASANAFLGLKVGLTVSASIPAAVISMGVLRFFKKSNVLENNIVQTCASAGEALTAGISFTLPALIVIRYWNHFDYLSSFIIAAVGGTLGVLFSIPLRRVLLSEPTLRFPEGTAIGKVLMASSSGTQALMNLILGSSVGAVIALCQTGFKLLSDNLQVWFKIDNTVVGGGLGFTPALIGAGYIIGINVALSIFLGVILGWIIGVPVLTYVYGIPAHMAMSDVAMQMWGDHIRYIGLGTMMIGGFWAIVSLIKPVTSGIKASINSVKHTKLHGSSHILRTDKDLSIVLVFWLIALLIIPMYFLTSHFTFSSVLDLNFWKVHVLTGTSILLIITLGFCLASICGYFAGLVGSSANPLSSMALISLIIVSFIVLLFIQGQADVLSQNARGIAAAAVAIMVTAVIAAAASICNDTVQDLKAGQMVGATPWKQQAMLILGVIIASLCIPLILQLLFDAYGLAGVMPHANMDPSQMLLAPQAGLMAAIVQGIFTHDMAWNMLLIGAVIAVIVLVIDAKLQKRELRLPVLAVGIGIYLPASTSMALVIGGVLSFIVERGLHRKHEATSQEYRLAHQSGLMLACGLVAGAAVMGVILAIPFAIKGSADVLSLMPTQYASLAGYLSLVITLLLCAWFWHRIVKA